MKKILSRTQNNLKALRDFYRNTNGINYCCPNAKYTGLLDRCMMWRCSPEQIQNQWKLDDLAGIPDWNVEKGRPKFSTTQN